ncbi:pilus assembly protein PilM [Planctomycetota bacterium]|nr:pilus assembly protein PilM [Planctomycetota bacterium]
MLFGKSKRILAIDIGSSEIKALEVSDSGSGISLNGFASTKIGNQNETIFAIKEILRHANFKTRRCVTSVSGRSVIVRYVTMNQMPMEDLRQAIRFEADKYIPFEVDEVVMDCQILEPELPDSDGEMKVLLVAVRKSLIEEHLALLQEAGLQSAIIDVDAFALGNAFEVRARASGGLSSEKVVALIDIGSNKTNINILKGPVSYFTREVYLAGNDFTEAVSRKFNLDTAEAERLKCDPADQAPEVEEAILPTLDDLGNEIQLSFDYFENQFDRVVEEVYISGGSAQLPGLQRGFEGAFEKSVIFWNPLEQVDVKSERIDVKALNQYAGQLAVGIGLASRVRRW